MKKVWLCIFTSAFLFACGEPTSEPGDQPSKEELAAQGKADNGVDWCEVLDWYGDGVCDTFCLNPDPDCEEEVDCKLAFVVPNCEAGSVLVDEVTCDAAGDDCETGELCGVQSHCLFVGEFCPQVVGTPAACSVGFEEVETCQTLECQIERGSGGDCTDLAFCEPVLDCAVAFVVPGCESGEILVEAMTCLAAGDDCELREECGVKSHCLFVGEFCPQVVGTPASCPGDSTEVDQCTTEDCDIVRGTGDKCADVVFCEPTFNCLALPSCGAGEISISTEQCEDSGNACSTQTVCGSTVHCWDFPKFCPQVVGTPPVCPAGTNEVSGCPTRLLDNGSCTLRNGTGDKCATWIYCQ